MDIIIRPSLSPWSSLVILKKKPDGTYRFLVDSCHLNSVTKKDAYLQLSAEELIYCLSGHSYFTKLNLNGGQFQIPIIESDKERAAFFSLPMNIMSLMFLLRILQTLLQFFKAL